MDLPISTMTTEQKIDAMEQLWASLRSEGDYAPPEWHGEVLAERWLKIDRGETQFSSLDEVRQRIDRTRGGSSKQVAHRACGNPSRRRI